MEEQSSPLSFYICQQILVNTLIASAYAEAQRLENMLNLFSCQQSENLSTAMISTSNYFHGTDNNRLTEDMPTDALQKKHFKVRQSRKFEGKSKSSLFPQRKNDIKSFDNEGTRLKLIPLKLQEDQSKVEDEQDELQQKMREIKVHQQYVRSRYAQNMRQTNKKTMNFHKMDAKATPKVPIYDYDGSLVAPLKSEAHRLPIHYLDLQVHVQVEQRQDKVVHSHVKKQGKIKNIVKFDQSAKKQNIRPVFSSFLKDLSNVEWTEGVEFGSKKGSCRKILGYNQVTYKKKLDLFKPSQKPIKIRFQQLQNYKTLEKKASQEVIQKQIKNQSSNTILSKQESRRLLQANKTIQVTNSKALQYLIREDEELQSRKRMSIFSNAKSLHSKPCESSVSLLKIVNSNVSFHSRMPGQVISKKRKVLIRQRTNDHILI